MEPIPATPFGPRVEAVIGLVTGAHLSRRVAVSLMSDVLGIDIDISLGAVSAIEERVSEAAKLPVDEAWARADEAPVKHTDGTSWYQAGVLCGLDHRHVGGDGLQDSHGCQGSDAVPAHERGSVEVSSPRSTA